MAAVDCISITCQCRRWIQNTREGEMQTGFGTLHIVPVLIKLTSLLITVAGQNFWMYFAVLRDNLWPYFILQHCARDSPC